MSMELDLSHLGRHGRGDEHLDRTFAPAAFSAAPDAEYRIAVPVHLVLDVHKDAEAFRVSGRVETRLALECGRCLEPFEIEVNAPFDLRYVPQEQGARDEHEIREDDLTTAYYRGDTLDLEELMREQFQLSLPMKPLCREDCKGLCPQCGTNLNTATCDCHPQWKDPRLAALEGLLDRSKTH